MGYFGFGQRNERGQLLLDFARSQELFITNSMFKKRDKRRATWSMGNTNNEIDFVMVKNEMKSLVKNVSIINKLEYTSNHKMLRMEINLKTLKKKFKIFSPKISVNENVSDILKFKRDLAKEISKDGSTGVNLTTNIQREL